MKRIIYDVPRWSIFLHRQARRMPSVELDDSPLVQFQDELFELLYSGEISALDCAAQPTPITTWAQRVHAQCDDLPSFARLAVDCRGDCDAAALGVEELMAELGPQLEQVQPVPTDDAGLRRCLRSACSKAADAVGEFRDAMQGLEHVAFTRGPDNQQARDLARQLRDDPRLRRIALLAGRFKRIAGTKRRQRVRYGVDEVVDVEQGSDLGRLLPAELAKLTRWRLKLAALRDILEQQALQYRLEGKETLGKGPLVVAIDKSGSMEGTSDTWSTAVALSLLDQAQREKRPFALLAFDSAVKYEAVVKPGGCLPSDGLFVPCNGGTNVSRAVARGLEIIEQHPGSLRKADVIIITDGASDPADADQLRVRATNLGVTILGFGIGVDAASLQPWCDEVQVAVDLSGLDDPAATQLFGR